MLCADIANAQRGPAFKTSCTTASHYGHGDGFHGRITASGERFNAYQDKTAAHRWLPLGTKVLVMNRRNSQAVYVTINDRGPFIPGRGIDLSYAAFVRIASPDKGLAKVCYHVVGD